MPAEGVLQYHIMRITDVSVREKRVQVVITDGFEARVASLPMGAKEEIRLNDARLNQLWARAEAVAMSVYRRAGHRAAADLLDAAADAMYEVIEADAEPVLADVIAAASQVLRGSRKQLELDKLYAMVRDADDDARLRFYSLVALIGLSRGGE